MDYDIVNGIRDQLRAWNRTQQHPRIVLMSGTGGKAFCAGGDLITLYNARQGKISPDIKRDFFAGANIIGWGLATMLPMQIAIWNGIVMGGGVGISCHSPIRIATDNSVYAMPETAIGFFNNAGGSYFLSRVKDDITLGLYLGLTGHRLKGRELLDWGFSTHFVPKERMEDLRADLYQIGHSDTDQDIQELVDKYADKSTS